MESRPSIVVAQILVSSVLQESFQYVHVIVVRRSVKSPHIPRPGCIHVGALPKQQPSGICMAFSSNRLQRVYALEALRLDVRPSRQQVKHNSLVLFPLYGME